MLLPVDRVLVVLFLAVLDLVGLLKYDEQTFEFNRYITNLVLLLAVLDLVGLLKYNEKLVNI